MQSAIFNNLYVHKLLTVLKGNVYNTIQYNRTNYAIDGVSHFDIHILELLYQQQALCIGNTDRATELIVARHDQERK